MDPSDTPVQALKRSNQHRKATGPTVRLRDWRRRSTNDPQQQLVECMSICETDAQPTSKVNAVAFGAFSLQVHEQGETPPVTGEVSAKVAKAFNQIDQRPYGVVMGSTKSELPQVTKVSG